MDNLVVQQMSHEIVLLYQMEEEMELTVQHSQNVLTIVVQEYVLVFTSYHVVEISVMAHTIQALVLVHIEPHVLVHHLADELIQVQLIVVMKHDVHGKQLLISHYQIERLALIEHTGLKTIPLLLLT